MCADRRAKHRSTEISACTDAYGTDESRRGGTGGILSGSGNDDVTQYILKSLGCRSDQADLRHMGQKDEVEAVELAKKQLDVYYKQGVYPYSVQIQYDNLYSYSSELYCYMDTSFDTYAAYLWKITFTKYDNSVENIVYMTESGTILLAWTNNTKFAQTTTLLDFYENVQIRDVLGENKLYTASAMKYMPVASVTIPYPDAEEIKEIKNGALITLRVSGDLENLQALQYTTEHGQGIVLMPLQNNK